ERQRDALNRRDELARLFDLSRDILLTTDPGSEAIAILARHIARRFQLDYASICLPRGAGFERFEAGALDLRHALTENELHRTMSAATRDIEADTQSRAG